MKNLTSSLAAAPIGALLLGISSFGCGGGGGGGGTGGHAPTDAGGGGGAVGGGSGADAGACVSGGGNGTLSVKIVGTPGAVGSVSVSGATTQALAGSMDLAVAAGAYMITAARVAIAAGAMLARTAYEPSVDLGAPCVRAGQTTTVMVSYAVIATSGRLWAGNSTAGEEMLGFVPSSLAASGSPAADRTAGTVGAAGFTFDKAGNLWVIGGTTADPPLARYAASSFATASGAKTPDITLSSPSFGSGVPGPSVLAFDAAGNLWVAVVAANKLVRFTPAQIAASGTPTAAVEIAGISAPAGIAFDQSGNLFVAANGDDVVVRVNQLRLAASAMGADLTITANTPAPVIGPLPAPLGLAFDGAGNLWVNYDGRVARLTPADLTGTGPKTITPTIQIGLDVAALPEGIAFDEQGGLWLAYSAGKIARLAPTQLLVSGTVAPSVVISSANITYASWFAIYPAPAGTPLAHRLP